MQRRLLDLQELDLRLDQIAHQRKSLPELAALAELARDRAAVDRELVGVETEVSDLRREQRKADADVEQVKLRRVRDQQRLDAGRVSSPKELESLQHEIASLDRRIADLEDAELEVMERLETAEAALAELRARADGFAGRHSELETSRDAATKELDEQHAVLAGQRTATAAELPGELLETYQRLRARLDGVGAARLAGKRCTGCRMELNAADLGRIRTADPAAVLRCEECGRILVRTPDSAA